MLHSPQRAGGAGGMAHHYNMDFQTGLAGSRALRTIIKLRMSKPADLSKPELFAHLDRYDHVVRMFHDESDRAAAILGATYLETLLGKLLRTKFVQSPSTEMFSGHGLLASFSSRVDIAYALGLFDEDVYRDLNLIRRIRNDFAHNIDYATFAEPAIRQRCAEFSFVKLLSSQEPNDVIHGPREQFLLTVGYVSLEMTRPFHKEWLAPYQKEMEQPKK
jgi:DNA-binding MltR family transcriptional regulator